MNLYVLRHAEAEPKGPSWAAHDHERPLTPSGIKKFERSLKGLRGLELKIDLVLSSPFTRARQTAEIFCRAFKAGRKLEFTLHLIPSGDPRKLISDLRQSYADRENIVIVGHEPYLSELVSQLIGGDIYSNLALKKGGICKLEADKLAYDRCATLKWLLTPRQLLLMAGD
jgi:phosphohistidine phosphatase